MRPQRPKNHPLRHFLLFQNYPNNYNIHCTLVEGISAGKNRYEVNELDGVDMEKEGLGVVMAAVFLAGEMAGSGVLAMPAAMVGTSQEFCTLDIKIFLPKRRYFPRFLRFVLCDSVHHQCVLHRIKIGRVLGHSPREVSGGVQGHHSRPLPNNWRKDSREVGTVSCQCTRAVSDPSLLGTRTACSCQIMQMRRSLGSLGHGTCNPVKQFQEIIHNFELMCSFKKRSPWFGSVPKPKIKLLSKAPSSKQLRVRVLHHRDTVRGGHRVHSVDLAALQLNICHVGRGQPVSLPLDGFGRGVTHSLDVDGNPQGLLVSWTTKHN